MSWTQQAKLFAKQIKETSGPAWWSFVSDIREAILDAKVMSVVLGQAKGEILVKDISSLRLMIAVELMKLGLRTETGELFTSNMDQHEPCVRRKRLPDDQE